MKAVFLFNFLQFIEWPPDSFASDDSPFIIGVLGADPFGEALDATVKGELIKGRAIEVIRYAQPSEISQCHMLFIAASEVEQVPQILQQLQGTATLTVGDTNNFARLGGMIRFITNSGKTRLAINLESAKAANLDINAKLLRLSEIVSSKKS